MDEKIREKLIEFIDKAYDKGYSKEAARIIGTVVCSEKAEVLGYSTCNNVGVLFYAK